MAEGPQQTAPTTPPLQGEPDGATARATTLGASAERARAASSRALDQADALLARGLASEARNASVVAGVHGDRARELEAAAREQEAHEVALNEAQARLIVGACEAFAGALGIATSEGAPSRAIWRELLRQVVDDGEKPGELQAPEREVEQVRGELRERVRRELRAELLDELRREVERERQERPALPVASGEEAKVVAVEPEEVDGEPAEPEAGGLPSWAELPGPWKRKYALDKYLGCWEYRNALERDRAHQQTPAPRRSRFPDFSHPALGGP